MKKPKKIKRNGVTYNLSKSGDYVNPGNSNDILTWLIVQDLLSSGDLSTDFSGGGLSDYHDSGSSFDSSDSGSSYDSGGSSGGSFGD